LCSRKNTSVFAVFSIADRCARFDALTLAGEHSFATRRVAARTPGQRERGVCLASGSASKDPPRSSGSPPRRATRQRPDGDLEVVPRH
jgi:hypothetical protein